MSRYLPHLCNIFTTIALYEHLQNAGVPKDKAFEVVSTQMWNYVEKGAALHRDPTLADGDSCCMYVMRRKGSPAEERWQKEHEGKDVPVK